MVDETNVLQGMSSSITEKCRKQEDVLEVNPPELEFNSNCKINHSCQAPDKGAENRFVGVEPDAFIKEDIHGSTGNGNVVGTPNANQINQSLGIEHPLSEGNEQNSWDSCSVSTEHEGNIVLEVRNSPVKLLSPELPILCNIAQEMPGINDVSIEMTFIDSTDYPWTSISVVKDHSQHFPDNSSGKPCDVSYEPVVENIYTTDFSVQTTLSQEEHSSDISDSAEFYEDVLFASKCTLQDGEEMIVEKLSLVGQTKELVHEEVVHLQQQNNSKILSNKEKRQDDSLHYSTRKRSYSAGSRSHSDHCSLFKPSRSAISCSADRINEKPREQKLINSCMGDSIVRPCKEKVKSLLEPFTQPFDQICPKSEVFRCKDLIYDCFILSVDDILPNQSANDKNKERGVESTSTSVSPEVPLPSEDEEGSDRACALVAMEIKHNPMKPPLQNIVDESGSDSDTDAWVFLDAEGRHQKVTQCDVNFLLGGRSADSVVSESKAHPISSVQRQTRSETDSAQAPLEPLIQESLMLLSYDDCGGEQVNPPRFKLERKKGDMLLYFDRNMNPVPSVRFISVDTQMVRIWRRRQDLQSDSFGELLE